MQSAILTNDRGGRWRVRVPDRRVERLRGLLRRRGMDVDEALLLPRCRSIHTLGMRFSIRTAFLDRDLAVLAVRDVPPGRMLVRNGRARHVLELPAGADVHSGDRFSLVLSTDEEPGVSAADILSRLLPR